jgi:hypothetical protein
MLTYAKYDILKSVKFEIQIKMVLHFYINYPFSRRPKSAIFEVLSALVEDTRQFRQREKRLNNCIVLRVHLPLYKQLLYNTKKLYFVMRRLSNMREAVPKNGGKVGRVKG